VQEEAQDHVTVQPYRVQRLKKKGLCIVFVLHVLLILHHFTCDMQLLEFKLLEIYKFT
jgi:hypothetical protein